MFSGVQLKKKAQYSALQFDTLLNSTEVSSSLVLAGIIIEKNNMQQYFKYCDIFSLTHCRLRSVRVNLWLIPI